MVSFMSRLKVDPKDAIGGVLLVLLGAYVLSQSFGYGLGTARRMGAGYFPMILGITAIAIGSVIALRSVGRTGSFEPVAWRPALAILAGIAAFGLLVRQVGLLPAVAVAGLLACLGDREIGTIESLVLVAVVVVGVWVVFLVGLQLPIAAVRMPF